jgi:hypothetical protein
MLALNPALPGKRHTTNNNVMKTSIFSTLFLIAASAASAQWNASGTHIYNSNSGGVGIGISAPTGKLEINGAGGQLRLSGGTVAGGVWTSSTDVLYLADWATGMKGLAINMSNGQINVGGDPGTDTGYGAVVQMMGASGNSDPLWLARYNNGNNFSELRVNIGDDFGQAQDMFVVGTHHWNGNVWYPHLAVQASGNVGIGTVTPDAKLTVKGDVHTREVRVDMNGAVGPDYVFKKDYNLLSLEALEAYINQNKHLPEVPSARDMDANGLNLKEMNLLLLKKVEELTLHLIEIKKEVVQLQKDNQTLKDKAARH